MKNLIKKALLLAGADEVGVCDAKRYDELIPILEGSSVPMVSEDIEKRINPFLIMPDAKSVIVFLVSYKSQMSGNISSYAYGRDYHTVLSEIADNCIELLEKNGYKGKYFADTGDLLDRHLAYLAGLGFFGKNHFLINEKYGSYIFIGYIITDCPLSCDAVKAGECKNCGKCKISCPTGALKNGDFSKCLSYITQKKGELSEEEECLIIENNTIWGCDICQAVCPHNENVPLARNENFFRNIITELSIPRDITNKEFKREYGEKAFSWRGKNVILRNQEIINKEKKN